MEVVVVIDVRASRAVGSSVGPATRSRAASQLHPAKKSVAVAGGSAPTATTAGGAERRRSGQAAAAADAEALEHLAHERREEHHHEERGGEPDHQSHGPHGATVARVRSPSARRMRSGRTAVSGGRPAPGRSIRRALKSGPLRAGHIPLQVIAHHPHVRPGGYPQRVQCPAVDDGLRLSYPHLALDQDGVEEGRQRVTLDLAPLLPGVAVGDERQWQPAGAERTQELRASGNSVMTARRRAAKSSATTAARRGSAAPQRSSACATIVVHARSMSVRSRR